MQEEITQKTLALCVEASKMTAQLLQQAMKKVLADMEKHKTNPQLHHGKQTIRQLIEKTREKIAEQQKRLRALEAQLTEEENLEIVRMVKAVRMDNRELTAFLRAYASGMISLPDGLMETEESEGAEDEA